MSSHHRRTPAPRQPPPRLPPIPSPRSSNPHPSFLPFLSRPTFPYVPSQTFPPPRPCNYIPAALLQLQSSSHRAENPRKSRPTGKRKNEEKDDGHQFNTRRSVFRPARSERRKELDPQKKIKGNEERQLSISDGKRTAETSKNVPQAVVQLADPKCDLGHGRPSKEEVSSEKLLESSLPQEGSAMLDLNEPRNDHMSSTMLQRSAAVSVQSEPIKTVIPVPRAIERIRKTVGPRKKISNGNKKQGLPISVKRRTTETSKSEPKDARQLVGKEFSKCDLGHGGPSEAAFPTEKVLESSLPEEVYEAAKGSIVLDLNEPIDDQMNSTMLQGSQAVSVKSEPIMMLSPARRESERGHKHDLPENQMQSYSADQMGDKGFPEVDPDENVPPEVDLSTERELRISFAKKNSDEHVLKFPSLTTASDVSNKSENLEEVEQSISPFLLKWAGKFLEELNTAGSDPTPEVECYEVEPDLSSILQSILAKHGDIAENCRWSSIMIRSSLLAVVCRVFRGLQVPLQKLRPDEFKSYYSALKAVEETGINVEWLLQRLDKVRDEVTRLKTLGDLKEAKKRNMELEESKRREMESQKQEMEKLELQIRVLQEQVESDSMESKNLERAREELASKVRYYRNKRLVDDLF